MYLGPGLGFCRYGRAASAPAPTITFDLASSIPAQLTFSRSSAATYRDSSGVWRSASSGVARTGSAAHYPEDSAEGFFWMELQITNKLTDRNANPTDATGWSKTGDAASTLAAVTAPGTTLTDAGLATLCSGGKVLKLDNTGGSAAAAMETTAQFGATSQHVISAWIYVASGTVTLTRTGGGTPETKTIAANAGFMRHALKVTPNNATDLMKISITAGGVAYYILGQMEQHAFVDEEGLGVPTTPIVTSAATATRNADRLNTTSLTSATWFNSSAGALVFEIYPVLYGPSTIQYLFTFANGSATSGGTANFHSVRLNNDKGYTRSSVVTAGAAATQISTDKPRLRFKSSFAYTWKNGENTVVSPVTSATISGYTEPTGPYDRLEIGKLHSSSSPFVGGFKTITVYDVHMGVQSLVQAMLTDDDKGGLYLGQSNGKGGFRSTPVNDNTGQRRSYTVLDAYQTDTRNWLIDGCTNGSALLQANDGGSGYWLDDGGVAGQVSAWGTAWDHAEPIIRGWAQSAAAVPFVIWNQGDGGISAVDPARHKAGIINLAQRVWSALGQEVPFILDMKGRRADSTQTQLVRNVYLELDADPAYPNIVAGPEVSDLTLADTIHYVETPLGYDLAFPRAVRKGLDLTGYSVTGGVDGPRITSVARSGTTVTVTLSHDAGTDFTPTTGIEGFYYYDGASPISVTAAVRTNATTITLTLAGTPSGVETFYHYYSGMNGVTAANLVRDNSVNVLPLRYARFDDADTM